MVIYYISCFIITNYDSLDVIFNYVVRFNVMAYYDDVHFMVKDNNFHIIIYCVDDLYFMVTRNFDAFINIAYDYLHVKAMFNDFYVFDTFIII